MQRAREADPFSAIIQANEIRVLVNARRFDQAIDVGRKAVRDNPNFAPPHFFLAQALQASGNTQEAAAMYRRAWERIPTTPQGIWHRGRAEVLEGKRLEALATVAELQKLSAERYVSPSFVATILLSLGEKDRAFEWLERAVEDHSYDMIYLKVDPIFDGVRDDPRLSTLVRKVGLEPPKR
jgi:tetratricopeptide (TPR) repeat protein